MAAKESAGVAGSDADQVDQAALGVAALSVIEAVEGRREDPVDDVRGSAHGEVLCRTGGAAREEAGRPVVAG